MEEDKGVNNYTIVQLEQEIARLESICREDAADYQTLVSLGSAYTITKRYQEAVSAYAKAVHRLPDSAEARYNLSVALEQAGFFKEAIAALKQALSLQPDFASAAGRLHKLENTQVRESAGETGQLPDNSAAPFDIVPPFISAAEKTESFLQIELSANFDLTRDTSIPPYTGFGTTQTASNALPRFGSLTSSTDPNGKTPATVPSQTYTDYLATPKHMVDDKFDLKQAARDFWLIIINPHKFFEGQQDRRGFMGPLSILIIFSLLAAGGAFITNLFTSPISAITSLIAYPFAFIGSLIGVIVAYLFATVFYHFMGKPFGNHEPLESTFRATVYSNAPQFLLTIVASFIVGIMILTGPKTSAPSLENLTILPGSLSGRQTTPNLSPAQETQKIINLALRQYAPQMICSTIGWLWSMVVLGIGISHMQKISAGSANLVVMLVNLLWFVIVLIIILLFTGLIFGLVGFFMRTGNTAGVSGH